MPRASSQQLLIAWRNASRLGIYGLLFSILLYVLLLQGFSVANAGLWLAVTLSLSLARMLLGFHFVGSGDENEIRASYWLYVLMTALVSLSWGYAVYLLSPGTPYIVVLIVTASVCLVSVIGMISSYTVLLGSLAYLFPVSLLQITWLLTHQPQYYAWISLLLAVFTLVMLAVMLTANRQNNRLITLNQDNSTLLAELKKTNTLLEEKLHGLETAERFATEYEQRFKGLVEASPDSILVTDRNGKIIFANQACLEKFEYLQDELPGLPIQTLIPEFCKSLQNQEPYENDDTDNCREQTVKEIFCRQKSGEIFGADISLIPVKNDRDEFLYVYIRDTSGQKHVDAFIREIREKELAQGQLQIEKERLQSYMDNIEVILIVVDEDLQVNLINSKGRKMLGLDTHVHVSLHELGGLLQRDYGEKTEFFLTDIFHRQVRETVFYRNTTVTPDGETHYLEWHLSQTQGADGRKYILASGTDISQRKRLEELITSVAVSLQIHGQESILDSLAKGLASTLGVDCVFIACLQGPAAEHFESLSYYRDGLILDKLRLNIAASPYKNILAGHSHSVLDKLDERYPADKLIAEIGAKSYLAVPLFDPKRKLVGMLALFYRRELKNINLERNICNIYSVIAAAEIERLNNLREKDRIERQLQQAQKMEAIGQLTGGVAHDFNNMLASMLGFTELAMFKADKNNEKLVQYLSNIYDTGEKAKELVSQMLTFSRQVRGEMQAIKMADVVKEALKMVRPMLPSSIQINTSIDSSLPLLDGDSVQLNQALLNLIINARDAIGEKGTIGIETRLISHASGVCSSCLQYIEGEMLELSVSDTGSGIVYEQLERIFEPFITSKDIGKGTGMGLAMVHGIVHEHGGHVHVETVPGKGSTFKLYFPVAQNNLQATDSDANHIKPVNRDGAGRRVMVIDDEIMVVNLLNEILTSYQYNVETYCDSSDALSAYSANPEKYDLVITDHTMPNMTGAELSQNILRLNPDQPIILCTGYSDYMDEEKAEELGIAAFMHKPLDHAELMHTVDLLTDAKH